MVSITEALRMSSLEDNQWARHALLTLGDELDPEMPVLAAVAGWTLRRTIDGEELVDTLFVLTETHLGFGQTTGSVGDPRWIPLNAVTSLDAIDDSPLPLQTVEMSVDSTMVMLVGWPGNFTLGFVEALKRTMEEPSGESMPGQLSGEVAVDSDASGLDDLGPSPFTERSVGHEAPPFSASPQNEGAEPAAVGAAADATTGFSTWERYEAEPLAVGEGPAVETDPPDAPWMDPACVWPEMVTGVTYLRGDPATPRKKKGGALIFSRRGIEAVGRGRRSWRVIVPWSQVESIDIQGTDEIAFSSGIKINVSASALVVNTAGGDQVIFEVAQRRPPSLRATLAPGLLMVDTARIWRSHR